MDERLPKEHLMQDSESATCGPTSLAMVYQKLGINITVADILRDFYQGPKGESTYVPQLARHLHGQGIKTKVLVSSSKILSPAWKNLNPRDLTANLKSWLTVHPDDYWHNNNLHLLFYLQEGGELDIVSYTEATIKEGLSRSSLFLVCVDENWLWGHRLKRENGDIKINDITGKLEGHFVVVTGSEEGQFHVLDPYPTGLKGKHGSYDVPAADVVNASLTWDPQIIEVFAKVS
jgi:hypothetical protein